MTQYGYRLFVIEALNGQGRKPLDFSSFASWDAQSPKEARGHLRSALDQFRQHRYTDIPTQIPTTPSASAKPQHLQFDTLQVSGNRIDGDLHFGAEGDFPSLSEQDDSTGQWQNTPMSKRAPVRPYRVHFLIPPSGTAGFMVAETVGRVCAGAHLLKILNTTSHNDLAYERGEETRQTSGWVRWRATPAVDDQRLENFIEEMRGAKLRLSRESRLGSGGVDTGAVTIEQDISEVAPTRIRALVDAWVRSSQKPHVQTKSKLQRLGARTAGVFFGELIDSGEFDSAEISAQEKGRTQRLAPESLDRLFEYPIGDVRPSKEALLTDASRSIRRMVGPMSTYKINESDLTLL